MSSEHGTALAEASFMHVVPYHVFVCEQQKPEGVPCCSARGAAGVIEELRAEVARRGLANDVQVTVCGSIGLCDRGPNVVVYPEGTWYSGVQRGDVAEIVESHFRGGRAVERLVNRDAGALRAEIAQNRARMVNALREKDASGALPDPLLQTIRAFQESRVILTAIELDVFSAVAAGSGTAPLTRFATRRSGRAARPAGRESAPPPTRRRRGGPRRPQIHRDRPFEFRRRGRRALPPAARQPRNR
jgi:(2Fe-2S) ferredoxin